MYPRGTLYNPTGLVPLIAMFLTFLPKKSHKFPLWKMPLFLPEFLCQSPNLRNQAPLDPVFPPLFLYIVVNLCLNIAVSICVQAAICTSTWL